MGRNGTVKRRARALVAALAILVLTVAAALTLQRAGAHALAAECADVAVGRGRSPAALRARGDIAKARGDKARALADYEILAAEVDDPSVRLALCKLYEHHVRSFAQALALVEKGTGEDDEGMARRRSRLTRKLAKAKPGCEGKNQRAKGKGGRDGSGSPPFGLLLPPPLPPR